MCDIYNIIEAGIAK